jgi:hypothetical protein
MNADQLLWPASYDSHLLAGIIEERGDSVLVHIGPDWPAPGLAYLEWSQVVRIIEGVRDRHWQRFQQGAGIQQKAARVVRVEGYLSKPMTAGTTYEIGCRVSRLDRRGYTLRVEVRTAPPPPALGSTGDFVVECRFVDRTTGHPA